MKVQKWQVFGILTGLWLSACAGSTYQDVELSDESRFRYLAEICIKQHILEGNPLFDTHLPPVEGDLGRVSIGVVSFMGGAYIIGVAELRETYPDAPYASCYFDPHTSKVIAVIFRSIDSAGKAVESEVWFAEKRRLFADTAMMERQSKDWIITAHYMFSLDEFSAILQK